MNDFSTIPDQHEDSPLPPTSRMRRWQLGALIAGAAMIVGALAFMLWPRGEQTPEAPRDIQFGSPDVFREAVVGLPRYVNPLLAATQADRDLAALVFSGLTRVDEFGQPVPDLAESWIVSDDGLTYTFHLRTNVTWHDGHPFTAEDVAFTMSLLREPDFPGPQALAAFWRTIETYADDDYTVRFVLTQPLASFPEYAGLGIVPRHWLGAVPVTGLLDDPFNLSPVGTGRLSWSALAEDGGVTAVRLEPYPGYYDASRRVTIPALELKFYEDAGDAFRALGPDVQAFGGLSAPQLEAALRTPLLNVFSSRLPVYAAVIFNQTDAENLSFFQDEKVRQALFLALDRGTLVANALGPEALVANSPILPGSWAYNSSLNVPPPSPDGAAVLLDEAGWVATNGHREREGTPLAFTLLVSDRPEHRTLADAIAASWGAVGVQVDVQVVEPDELLVHLQPEGTDSVPDFEAAIVEFSQGGFADPDPYPFWHESQSGAGQNYGGFKDRDISVALEIGRRDANGVRRAEAYREFQQLFLDQAAAVLLYNPVYHYAVSCQVQGTQAIILAEPSDRFNNLHEWRMLGPDQAASACNSEGQ